MIDDIFGTLNNNKHKNNLCGFSLRAIKLRL